MLNSTEQQDSSMEKQNVSMESLSEMTGFPVEFIKKELLISQNQVSLDDLRRSVLDYLQTAQPQVMDN
jgi:bisphosphoglycerate-independent phosphoglycerate mutase (AlkP superfamily)